MIYNLKVAVYEKRYTRAPVSFSLQHPMKKQLDLIGQPYVVLVTKHYIRRRRILQQTSKIALSPQSLIAIFNNSYSPRKTLCVSLKYFSGAISRAVIPYNK